MNIKEKQIMLITYPDCMGKNLKDLYGVLAEWVRDAVGSVHILPFFPSSADRGFAPVTYREIDPAFGNWEDMDRIARKYDVMCDCMVNHVSAHSKEYLDYLKYKDQSDYRDFFIRFSEFWDGGMPTEEEEKILYKRKAGGPFVEAEFTDGTKEKIWSTFSSEQIDLDCRKAVVRQSVDRNLRELADRGMKWIRLDAVGYATKKAGTKCFFEEPQIWKLMEEFGNAVSGHGAEILPEIHENYFTQLKIAEKGYWVYDFALPLLVLNALYFGEGMYLKNWLKLCPEKQFTTLDTHDGIGVMDAQYLMPDQEIERTLERLYQISPFSKTISTKSSQTKFEAYQVNCSYFSALEENETAYLTARAIQFFTPGIPMVYYMGLLAGKNDEELVKRTGEGRDINRRFYTTEQVREAFGQPIVKRLLQMMRFRNTHPAFGGRLIIQDSEPWELNLCWKYQEHRVWLKVDLKHPNYEISYTENGAVKHL